MNKPKYRWFQAYEKEKLESLVGNSPILEPIEGMTPTGWRITNYKILVNVSWLSATIGREPKTIVNELIRGSYTEIPMSIEQQTKLLCYSKGVSDSKRFKTNKLKQRQTLKIYQHQDLLKFVLSNKGKQSLNSIAGRTKLENLSTTISHQTLYNYVDNDRVKEIDRGWLTRSKKQHYRLKSKGKRVNGISIEERPEVINSRDEFGHWEIDLIEGKRGTGTHLLTMCERKTRIGIAIKIHGKKAKNIVKGLRILQEKYVLEFGHNIKSITTDNGSEFWGWQEFQKSIYSACKSISVYFCHPYSSCEKGGVENFNKQIRRKYAKGTDFTNVSVIDLYQNIMWINSICRPG